MFLQCLPALVVVGVNTGAAGPVGHCHAEGGLEHKRLQRKHGYYTDVQRTTVRLDLCWRPCLKSDLYRWNDMLNINVDDNIIIWNPIFVCIAVWSGGVHCE